MIDFVRITEERIKILKKNKKFIEQLQKLSETKIKLNEEISLESEDSLKILRVKLVLQAFGRGFDFDTALNLLDEDFYLECINIKEFTGKSRTRMTTLKGRVIGTKGKTKKMIEKFSETKIAIYGKMISIIGRWEGLSIAKQAIEMLLQGSLHSTIYRFLERSKK